ncbi:MAG: hypothetical protein ACRELE_12620 [Gemmatimonadales bacterium]
MIFRGQSLVRKLLLHGLPFAVGAILTVPLAYAQISVVPIINPHMTFVDAAGLPCSQCTLSTFAAGTTTPLATYTDSTGTAQNTNPIVLDPAGGANVWLSGNSYKLVLKSFLGATIWTVDNVNPGGLLPCSTPSAIQISNTGATGLTCDPTITINTSAHTINLGTLPKDHVTIGASGTPTAWTLDTTSPATALASMGALGDGAGTTTPNLLAVSTASAHVIGYSRSIPAGITAITQAPNDNSTNPATTAYVAMPGDISPSSIKTPKVTLASGTALTGNQGNGSLVQHAAGSTSAGHCGEYDANGNLIDSGSGCGATLIVGTQIDVTSSRAFNTIFTNSATSEILVTGYGITGGSSVGSVEAQVSGISVFAQTCTATISAGTCGFSFAVPAGAAYVIFANTKTNGMGTSVGNVGKWIETTQN